MRIVNFILAVMFLLFAFVQINDPDPVIWILIYGAMAVLCIMAIFEFYPTKFTIGLLVLYVLYSIVYIPGVLEWLRQENKAMLFDDVAKMQYPYVEEAREFLGLVICIIVLIVFVIRARRKRYLAKSARNYINQIRQIFFVGLISFRDVENIFYSISR